MPIKNMLKFILLIYVLVILLSHNLVAQNLAHESAEQAEKFIKKYFLEFENYFFSFDTRRSSDAVHSPEYEVVNQFYNLHYGVNSNTLSIADSLNEISWKGRLIIKWEAYRFITSDFNQSFNDETWYDWVDKDRVEIHFAKKRGEWRFYDLYKESIKRYIGKRKPTKEKVLEVLSKPPD